MGCGSSRGRGDQFSHFLINHSDTDTPVDIASFQFENLDDAWKVLAGVTADLTPEKQEEAKRAMQDAMWPEPASAREFHNATHYIIAVKPR